MTCACSGIDHRVMTDCACPCHLTDSLGRLARQACRDRKILLEALRSIMALTAAPLGFTPCSQCARIPQIAEAALLKTLEPLKENE